MSAEQRSFLFLQGPLSYFFLRLGKALRQQGCAVHRVNFCGGDVLYWPWGGTHLWRGHLYEWPQWIAGLMDKCGTTDVVLLGDWRPLHREAIWLARQRGARIWVYEFGYLRPNYLTLEEGGVNAFSPLPHTPDDVRKRSEELCGQVEPRESRAPNPMRGRVVKTIMNHVGNVLLWPLFPHYKTHRPYCAGRELMGWIPRWLSRKRRRAHGIATTRNLLQAHTKFYLMPLQLDADAQIRRHSPFTGILECMAQVITNFAQHAPKDAFLVVKNHPLDNGLLNYRRYMRSLARATGCSERLRFVEEVDSTLLCAKAEAVVLCNSTLGLSALQMGKAVYCLGTSIYAMPGLAVDVQQMPLENFWHDHPEPDSTLLQDFLRVLRHDALVPGNFYSPQGINDAIAASLPRMGLGKQHA